jgi:hypothetical protein
LRTKAGVNSYGGTKVRIHVRRSGVLGVEL